MSFAGSPCGGDVMRARQFAMLALLLIPGEAVAGPEREATLPAGTLLRVRLDNTVGSDISHVEDSVRARLVSPIVVGGRTLVPVGSAVTGSVTQAMRSGKVKGRARLGIRFNTLAP